MATVTPRLHRRQRAQRCQLRLLRKEKNLTPTLISEKLDVGESTVWGWESGQHLPDALVGASLCDLLDCTLEDLYPSDAKGGNHVGTRKKSRHSG
jgi:transcriptional regulator with XRE-family HTH domain